MIKLTNVIHDSGIKKSDGNANSVAGIYARSDKSSILNANVLLVQHGLGFHK
jgi:hypothetical protein